MFGLNDNGSQQGGTPPASAPPVMPTVEPTAPADMTMAMPMPDQSTAATTPSVPTEEPTAPPVPATEPSMTEPLMPDPLTLPTDSSTADETDYSAPDSPQISSNYDPKPGSAPMAALGNEDELLDIKKQALQSLAPLVNELEQNPEEKFKTTMMLIQASDNADLVKDAFTAANAISDEKARAQALLDVVNEINYFTHGHTDPEA